MCFISHGIIFIHKCLKIVMRKFCGLLHLLLTFTQVLPRSKNATYFLYCWRQLNKYFNNSVILHWTSFNCYRLLCYHKNLQNTSKLVWSQLKIRLININLILNAKGPTIYICFIICDTLEDLQIVAGYVRLSDVGGGG